MLLVCGIIYHSLLNGNIVLSRQKLRKIDTGGTFIKIGDRRFWEFLGKVAQAWPTHKAILYQACARMGPEWGNTRFIAAQPIRFLKPFDN